MGKFNVKRYLLIVVSLSVGGIVGGYLMAANSLAFKAARTFLLNHPKVIETLGPIQSSRLGFNYGIQYRAKDTAKIQVVLKGQHYSGDAYLTLEGIDGVWKVKSGNLILDGESPISLLPEIK